MRELEEKPRLPLKTVLQNFLNKVDSMETKKERDNPFEREFKVRRKVFEFERTKCPQGFVCSNVCLNWPTLVFP
jgi:hypothetical protein